MEHWCVSLLTTHCTLSRLAAHRNRHPLCIPLTLRFLFFILNCRQDFNALKPGTSPATHHLLTHGVHTHRRHAHKCGITQTHFPSAAHHQNPGASVPSVRSWQRRGLLKDGYKHTRLCILLSCHQLCQQLLTYVLFIIDSPPCWHFLCANWTCCNFFL